MIQGQFHDDLYSAWIYAYFLDQEGDRERLEADWVDRDFDIEYPKRPLAGWVQDTSDNFAAQHLVVVFTKEGFKNLEHMIGLITHESLHIATKVFRARGVYLDLDAADEHIAYYQGWIAQKITVAINIGHLTLEPLDA